MKLDKIWSVLGLIETEETDGRAVQEKQTGRAEQTIERKQERFVQPQAPPRQPAPAASKTPSSAGLGITAQTSASSAALVISHPAGFDDARQIADHLTHSRTVVVNFSKTDTETTKRTIDFMSGITYAVGGGVQRISGNIFVFAPDRVEIIFPDNATEPERGSLPWTRT